jgi:fructose-1,6-bisphosphatase/inositol monophosphatase family enzyme
VFEQLRAASRLARGWGDCYGYALVATGRAEVMVDPILSIWDMGALPTILTEAGGTFTDWQGKPTIYGRDGIATNGHVLNEVMEFTRGK